MWRGVLVTIVVLLLVAVPVSAVPGPNDLVCGSTPDSFTGHGGLDLCNIFYACGLADGVCPEDFYSSVTEQRGSCSNCPDPDCIATISGTVRTDLGEVVPNAEVFAFYDGDQGTVVRSVATTDFNGVYSASDIPSGFLSFYVDYEDFESPTQRQRIVRGESHIQDFGIAQGSCNADCTGTVSNRCQATCEGVNGCSYASNTDYSATDIATLCDEKVPGERILLDVNGNTLTFVDCCNGAIYDETRNTVDIEVDSNTQISNLVSYVQRARLNGEQVQLVITTWNENE